MFYCLIESIFCFYSSVEFIGRAAFWKCKKLEKVIWQEGIEVIGKWAFQESGLEQAVLPDFPANVAFPLLPVAVIL